MLAAMVRFPVAVTLAATLALALGATAEASSIVYVKSGDVWLAKANGRGKRAITKDGTPSAPYRSPAYSNGGVITAVKGRRDIHFFNRRGKRIRRKRDISGGPVAPFDPVVVDHSISPDGRRLASTLWLTTRVATPKPHEPTGSDLGTTVWYTGARDGRIQGRTDGGQNPTWISSSRPIVFAPYVYNSADAWLVDLAVPNSPTQWFQDRAGPGVFDGEPLDDGELSRSGTKLAVVRGPNTTASSAATMVRVYAVAGLSQRPAERCDLRTGPAKRIESPSWSPDGRSLAWSERSGIWVTPIAGGGGDCGARPRLLIRGGSQPDWGPARVP
jgi:hypothetical protein